MSLAGDDIDDLIASPIPVLPRSLSMSLSRRPLMFALSQKSSPHYPPVR